MEVASSEASVIIVALADTGASTTLLTRSVAERIRLVIKDSDVELTGLSGRSSTIGEAMVGLRVTGVDLKLRTRVIVVEFLPEGQEMLLACGDLKSFGLIHQDFPKPYSTKGDTTHIVSGSRGSPQSSSGRKLRSMEDAFHAAEVDSEPLTVSNTVFRHDEDDDVEDIPGIDDMPDIIKNILYKHRSVFATDLSADRKIKCEPMHLTRKPGVELPSKCRRARLTPHHYRPRAKAIIDKMLACGILVKVDECTPAVSAGFFVKKPHGNGIRFVADYTAVNKAIERPPHHFPAPQEVWQRVTPGSKYFVAGDLAAGYWQCELDYESSLLTTCITEFGKVRFT